MKALVLVAHGSRREASNDEVRQLTENLAKQAGDRYGFVTCAFLELALPSIPDGIECCIRRGASQVDVLPYFLSAGRHVIKDVPDEVATKQAEYPDIQINIAPYLGASSGITGLLLDLVQN